MADDRLGRFQGCLIGLAVGDALGAPLEFMTEAEIARQYGPVREYRGGGWLGLAPGEYTDDTQMMLCIARSIVAQGRFDPADVAERFVVWLDGGPKDAGNTTRRAIELLKGGVAWREAGERACAERGRMGAGNGSVMRCAPIALLDYRDERRLIEDSWNSSLITHGDPRACWGAVALNLLIAGLVAGGGEGLVEAVAARIAEREVREALLAAPGLAIAELRPSGFVVDTLQTALRCFLGAGSFEEALVSAVNLGGDADTVGAVCGALAGARYGLSSIPAHWQAGLRGAEEIRELAAGILALAG